MGKRNAAAFVFLCVYLFFFFGGWGKLGEGIVKVWLKRKNHVPAWQVCLSEI